MKGILKTAEHLLFPPRCAVCTEVLPVKEWDALLCGTCREKTPFVPADRCMGCGMETKRAGLCADCIRRFPFSDCMAAFPYGEVRSAIRLFKYEGVKSFGGRLGSLMGDFLLLNRPEWAERADGILPIPLHPKKLKRRGFNQAELLACAISEKTGIPLFSDLLERKEDTVPQSTLSVEERKKNLKDGFRLTGEVAGKTILLVDDIFTTGTTCGECARTLLRGGAKEVFVYCLSSAGHAEDGAVL